MNEWMRLRGGLKNTMISRVFWSWKESVCVNGWKERKGNVKSIEECFLLRMYELVFDCEKCHAKVPKLSWTGWWMGKQNGTGENLMLDAMLGRKCKTNTDECEWMGIVKKRCSNRRDGWEKKWTCTDERGRKKSWQKIGDYFGGTRRNKNKPCTRVRLDSDESNKEPSRKYLRRNKRANSYKNA